MNILAQAYNYLDFIFKSSPVGFKALLCDQETLKFISVAITKTELYKNEVYVINEISAFVRQPKDPEHESFSCFCILRPTSENMNLIRNELENPHFPKYNLYFTNIVTDQQIHQLANSDSNALIQNLQEIYIDFSALGTRLFSLNIPNIYDFRHNPSLSSFSDRIAEGIFASFCSLKLKPVIRYDSNSAVTKTIASKLSDLAQSNSDLFSGHQTENGLVLILDRLNDPVTPLLHGFYFYSIVHDLFTIDNNVVEIGKDKIPIDERNDPETEKIGPMYLEEAQISIAARNDNYKKLMNQIHDTQEQDLTEKAIKIQQSSKEKNYTDNNLTLSDAFFNKIKSDNLFNITSLEQYIASSDDAGKQFNLLNELITSSKCAPLDALRVSLIFMLRYEKSEPRMISEILAALSSKYQWSGQEMEYGNALLAIAGEAKRAGDIFSNKNTIVKFIKNIKNLNEKSQFEMYHPPLENILKDIKECKLDQKQYPFIGKKSEPRKVIIFIIGGATYIEHMLVTKFSDKKTFQFILGGTTIHNANSFLKYEVEPFC
ncbi:vacuolar protein sorting-associated protein 45 [Tritrichomonas musculus]|uniref:Vacuolar protein sorting-associated protein 45 n=1 Tax=Tritrichomonas musculus TaxID=1915356 RepID=A0ABR2HYN8_9EUKA